VQHQPKKPDKQKAIKSTAQRATPPLRSARRKRILTTRADNRTPRAKKGEEHFFDGVPQANV
jgi:hypothetical protein